MINHSFSIPSSFLGGGSELLIRSVFEIGPQPSGGPSPEMVIPPTGPEAAGETERKAEAAGIFDSPLAKIFGRTSAKVGKESSKASSTEVEALQVEVKEIRESQLRMEELLSKLLSGGEK